MNNKNLNRYNFTFFIKLVVILISFCVFNLTVNAANLSSLEVVNYENDLVPSFDPSINSYELWMSPYDFDLNINATSLDQNAQVQVSNNKYLKEGSVVKINVSSQGNQNNLYEITIHKASALEDALYSYTGDVQSFVVPYTGNYVIEAWGASGGKGFVTYSGHNTRIENDYGRGAYTKGSIRLDKGTTLYVYVGGQGTKASKMSDVPAGGYNGGGNSSGKSTDNNEVGGSGGGATDVRLVNGTWNDSQSLASRIMVAAGGGGGCTTDLNYTNQIQGMMGGALEATGTISCWTNAWTPIVNQTTGNAFGKGANGIVSALSGAGAGGGYFGGVSVSGCGKSSGGSSYISGHTGAVAITSQTDLTPRKGTNNSTCLDGTTDELCSEHYSGYVFYDTQMISGNSSMPNTAKTSTETGHTGNGYLRVSELQTQSKDNYLTSLSTNHGTLTPSFDPTIENYTLSLDKYDLNFTVDGVLSDSSNATVSGLDFYEIDAGETKSVNIVVTAQSGDIRIYTISATRASLNPGEHSSLLKKLIINNEKSSLDPNFHPLTTDYELSILESDIDLSIDAQPFDDNATVVVENYQHIKGRRGTVTIRVSEEHSQDTIYTLNYVKDNKNISGYTYDYTGEYQIFEAPYSATYKAELWGASGGNVYATYIGNWPGQENLHGKGGYTAGEIELQKGDKLYIFVGEKGMKPAGMSASVHGGWNGGGTSLPSTDSDDYGGTGGGATDIRLVPTSSPNSWNEFLSLKSRIMVAGGGGGSAVARNNNYSGGMHAGGLSVSGKLSTWNSEWTPVVNQTRGYKFGVGADGVKSYLSAAGGGGGYYGGVQRGDANDSGRSAGGSSYISGHAGSNSIAENSTETNIIHTGSSIHYSGIKFNNTVMIDGAGYNWTSARTSQIGMPTIDGASTEIGHDGNGFAKISVSKLYSKDNYLSLIQTNKGVWNQEFDPLVYEYTITLENEDYDILVEARPSSDLANIDGLGLHEVPADINNDPIGPTQIPITVTAESGDIKVYTLYISRQANSEKYPNDISISGLVPSYCEMDDEFCKVNPAEFNKNTTDYDLVIPYKIKEIFFNVEKGHPYQSVNGEGSVSVKPNTNLFTIVTTSEDNSGFSLYNYHVIRDMTGDCDLSELNVIHPNVDLNYDPDITEYYFNVSNDIDRYVLNFNNTYNSSLSNTMQLYYQTDDNEASAYLLGEGNLKIGQNVVPIMVVAQNGETQTYTLNVYREPNSNVYLNNLEVKSIDEVTSYDLTPEFNKINFGTYKATVDKDIEQIKLIASAQSSTTTVSGTGIKQLVKGDNIFEITMTSQSGYVEIYKINVIREKDKNSYLSSLVVNIDGISYLYTPEFDKDTLTYTINAPIGASEVELSYTLESELSTSKLLDNNTIKVGNNLKRILVTAEDKSTRTYNINIIRPADTNNKLSYLRISNDKEEFELTPVFDALSNNNDYYLTVENEVSWVNVYGTKASSQAKMWGNGKYNLSVGVNKISIRVRSESGIDRVYKVNITRKPSSNAYLKNIVLSTGNLSPTFDKENLNYSVNVASDVETITVTGEAQNSTTKVVGNKTYQLAVGQNTITLTTLAQDNETSLTYTIIVTRDRSNNTNLSSLYLKEAKLSPTFDKNTIEYSARVPYDVENVNVVYKAENDTSTVSVEGNTNLIEGDNYVYVKVRSEDNQEKTYTIKVFRQAYSNVSTYLSSLNISSGTLDPTFTKTNPYYEVNLPYSTNQITISGTAEDEYADVLGNATYDIHTGENLLALTVVGQDYSTRDYIILVRRAKNDEARLSNVIIKNQSINFDKDTYSYNIITKENSLDFTSIIPIDSNATYEIVGNNFEEVGNYEVKIVVTAENGINQKEYVFNVQRLESNNANLINLEVENYEIGPTFDKNILHYDLMSEVENEVSSINIIAEAEEKHATITGDGLRNLEVGENILEVEVTSEDGTTKTYSIYVYRKGSDNNKIANLEVLNGTMLPAFDQNTSVYEVRVGYFEPSLNLNIELEDVNATYVVEGNSNFKEDIANIVKVLVISQSGKVRTIILNVFKEEAISGLLKDIEITNYKVLPNFDMYTFNYDVIVDYEVESLDLLPILLDKQGTYTISGNENFSVGNNTVTINTSSRDNNEHETYTLNVIRQAYINNFLSSLSVSDGELIPVFDKYTLAYNVYVGSDIESITLSGEAEDSSALVSGLGQKELVTGKNEFVISVNNSGIVRNYKVNVFKEDENNNYLLSLIVKANNINQILSPEFDSKVYDYNINVVASTDKLNLIGEVSEGAVATGLGIQNITLGNNELKIIVRSLSGKTREYTLNVYRPISNNADVLSIIPSSGTLTPTFDNTNKTYNLKVASNIEKLSFTVNKADKFATIEGADEQDLEVGFSQRKVIITAEDTTTKNEFTFNITRDDPNSATLDNLYVKNYTFDEVFNPNILEYHLTVDNSKASISPNDVVATSSDSNARVVKQTTTNLSTKEINEYLVNVTSYNGLNQKTYKIIITREKSNETLLDFLEVNKGKLSPVFNPNIKEYDLYEYINEEEINIEAQAANEDITILSGTGTILLDNSEIEHNIVLQAEDGTIGYYKINIHKNILLDEGLDNLYLNYDPYLEYLDTEFTLSPTFESTTLNYEIHVPYEYKILDLECVKQNEQQNVVLKIDDEEISEYYLLIGNNDIDIEVYDGLNKLTRTYHLNVIRSKSRNTYLRSLQILGYELTPVFNKYIQEYYIRVPSNLGDLELDDIIAIPEESRTKVYITGYRYLVEGNNDLVIELESDAKTTREYIVHVIKGEDKLSDLKNITVSTGIFHQLSPKFKSNVYDYNVVIPGIFDKATVEAAANDSSLVTITGVGEYDLRVGNNIVTITSTSTITGQTSIYTINIIKEADEDVDLISLSAKEGSLTPVFDRSTTKYKMHVGEDIEQLTLSYQTSNRFANVYVSGNKNFVSGENKVNIVVTNYEGTKTKTYQIIVTKDKNSNATLSGLRVYSYIDDEEINHQITPEFNVLERIYNVDVAYNIEKVIIDSTATKNTTTIIGNGEKYLNFGNNTFALTSTAENGNTIVYYVNIYRNHNLNLENITLSKGELSPVFDKDEVNYTVELDYEDDKITILGTPESNEVEITGNKTYNLSVGDNYIDLVVTAPDNRTKTYTINVIRGKDSNNYIKELQVNGILSQTFDKLIMTYNVDVRPDVKNLDIQVELESPNATYKILNNSLSEANNPNEVIIRVRAQNGDERDYKLNAWVRDWAYFSNRLRDLQVSVGQLTPDFNSDINNYAVSVENSIDEIEVTAIKQNSNQRVVMNGINGATQKVSLNVGRNIINIAVTDQFDIETSYYSLVIYRLEATDASLSNLVVQGHNFSPLFNRNRYEYNLTIGSEVENLNVIATPQDPNSRVEIEGNTNIPSGESQIRVKVIAPDNIHTKEYVINVNKLKSTNNYLVDIDIKDFELNETFTKNNQGIYTLLVPYLTTNILIKGVPEVKTTTVTGDGLIELNKGINIITLIATAESGDTRTYTLAVTRAYNHDSSLADIVISEGELNPVFNKDTLEYTVDVEEEVEEIDITGIPTDSNASVVGNGTYDLTNSEETEINLVVTAENKVDKTTYKVKFIRHVRASSYLSKLIVKDGELYPNFHKLITTYTILVPNEIKSLNMIYIPEDELANVEITGNSAFKVGTNKVHVIVTAKDNSSTTDYEISVVRQSKASNFLKSLTVKSEDNNTEYDLSPVFDKNTMYYEVMVPANTSTIRLGAEVEDNTSTLTSTQLGIKSLNNKENRYYITVEAASGAIRTYQVVVIKQDTNNKLLSLSSDIGDLSPVFNSEVNEYTLSVDKSATSINLSGEVSEGATVQGLGEVILDENTTTHQIIVSKDNQDNIYTITINKEDNSNAYLKSLTLSSGNLDPAFDKNVFEYDVMVDDGIGVITINAEAEDPTSIVSGTGIKSLNYGQNNFAIVVTTKSGSISKLTSINVTRVKSIQKINTQKDSIALDLNEEAQLEYSIVPIDATNKEVRFVVADPTIASVDSTGKVRAIKYGSTTINIISKQNENIYKTINVRVLNKKIVSNIYDIIRFSGEDLINTSELYTGNKMSYVIKIEPETTIENFIKNFDNDETTLYVYDKDDNLITDKTTYIATSMIIKLEIDDTLYDELKIVVRGDINNDGLITMTDYSELKSILLGTVPDYIKFLASDVNKDEVITMTDYTTLKSYLLKDINSLNN